jgi:hypothetical protein
MMFPEMTETAPNSPIALCIATASVIQRRPAGAGCQQQQNLPQQASDCAVDNKQRTAFVRMMPYMRPHRMLGSVTFQNTCHDIGQAVTTTETRSPRRAGCSAARKPET